MTGIPTFQKDLSHEDTRIDHAAVESLGPQSAKMLADRISITTMGIRQHLQQLEQRELVCYEEARTKVGRPTRYWSLTTKGHSQFPDRHQDLSRVILGAAQQLFGDEGVENSLMSAKTLCFSAMQRNWRNIPKAKNAFRHWLACAKTTATWPNLRLKMMPWC